jgi:hypothetical protein
MGGEGMKEARQLIFDGYECIKAQYLLLAG